MGEERPGEEIRFASDGETVDGYLSLPASGRGPGVVVIQEWWGLVDHIRDVCDRLAREGFAALAPDLYRGERADVPDAAGRLMRELDLERAARDLDGAVRALLDRDAVLGPRVGAVGFCMGGQLALFAATRNRRVGAVVDFYGVHPRLRPDFTGMDAPVLGLFGEHDAFVTPEAARVLEAELQRAGVRTQFRVFPGVGHAFMNETRPDGYDAEAAAQAWHDTVQFLRAELA